jgi:lipase chaperone LimK
LQATETTDDYPEAAQAAVMAKFPELAERIRELFQQDPIFQSLCEDYHDCRTALQQWQQSASEDASEVCQSYVELLQELEQDVRKYLESFPCNGANPWLG